jgi:hypothetical protein
MAVFWTDEDGGLDQIDYPLRSKDPFDRVRLLRDREVDCVICGAIQDVYEDVLRFSGFEVISWVSGFVEDLLTLYLRGGLESGAELPAEGGPHQLAMEQTEEA